MDFFIRVPPFFIILLITASGYPGALIVFGMLGFPHLIFLDMLMRIQMIHTVLMIAFAFYTIPEFKILAILFRSAANLALVHRMVLGEIDNITLPAVIILSASFEIDENILAEKY